MRIKIYETMILSVMVYGYERSLTLRAELRVFVNRILGPRMNENEERRGLHNGEICSLYLSPNIVRMFKSRILGWT